MEQMLFFNTPLATLEPVFKRWFKEAQREMLSNPGACDPGKDPQPADYTKGYVYGLKGIRRLFNVSHATAQRYKDTFLKPAVRQNGRKIVVDAAKALELFNEYNK
jgi:hypothetical protein